MKRTTSTIIAAAAALGIFAQLPIIAADTDPTQTGASKKSSMTQKLRGSKQKGAKVESKTGEDLGQIEDIIIDSDSGKILFAVVSSGGFGAKKYTPVPWEAITVVSEQDYKVNADKQKFQSAPTVAKDEFTSGSPDAIVAIYRFYEIAPPAAAGGTGAGTSSSSSSERSQGQKDQQQPNK